MDSLARYSYPVINWDDVRDCPFAKEEWVTPYDVDNSLCDFRKGSFPRAYCENVWRGVLLRAVLITVISLIVIWRLNIIFLNCYNNVAVLFISQNNKKTEVR